MNTITQNITKKRLAGELRLLQKDPLELIDTYPDDKDTLLWYFLLRGPDFTDYKGGFYIGKVLHNPEYPLKAPDFMMLTPNGRFEIEKKICLTNSGYHSESWSAAWNMKTILLGFLSIMADDSTSGISHIKRIPQERKFYADNSVEYNKQYHNDKWMKFERFVNPDGSPKSDEEIKLLSQPNKQNNKSETKSESNHEIKHDNKLQTKPELNHEIKHEIKHEPNIEIKAETKLKSRRQAQNNSRKPKVQTSKQPQSHTIKINFDINTFNSENILKYEFNKTDHQYKKILDEFKEYCL